MKEKLRLRGEAYSTGFLIECRAVGVKVSTRGLKGNMSPEEFLKVDLDTPGQWHGAEHKTILAVEEVLSRGGKLTLKMLKNASIKFPRCTDSNEWVAEPSEEQLREALWVGKQFLKKIRDKKR